MSRWLLSSRLVFLCSCQRSCFPVLSRLAMACTSSPHIYWSPFSSSSDQISSFLRFCVANRFTLNLCQFPVLPSRRWSSPLAIALSALSWLSLATMISTLWLSVQRWLVRCILQCIRNRGGRLEHTLGHLWELKRDHGHSLTVTLVGSVYCLNNA